MSYVEKIVQLLSEADKIAKENGISNLFYNEMFMELFAAQKLGHNWNPHTQGKDATEPEQNSPTEYKFINLRNKNKGSFQFHWLSNDKMDELSKTENMFFGLRDGVDIIEIYKLPTTKILPLIAEKATGSKKTDGHKSFSLKQIKELGAELVYENKKPL